jgi:hypothetical protein
MGVSTRSKTKLSAASDVKDQPSCGSVHSVKDKGKSLVRLPNPLLPSNNGKNVTIRLSVKLLMQNNLMPWLLY